MSIPSDFANLKCWVEADKDVYTDITGLSPAVNNGDKVCLWKDQSSLVNNVTDVAASAGNADCPLYEKAIVPVSLKPILRFNGTRSAMTGVFAMPSDPKSLFIYAKVAASPSANQVMFDQRSNDTMEIRINGSDTTKFDVYGGAFVTQALPVDAGGSFHLWEVIWNGSSSACYRDGSLINAATDGGGATSTGIMIGAYFGPSRWLAMDLAELVIYTDAKGTSDRQAIENYFTTKYGTPPAGTGGLAKKASNTLIN